MLTTLLTLLLAALWTSRGGDTTHPRDQLMGETVDEGISEFSGALPRAYRSTLTAISSELSKARDAAETQRKRMRQMWEDPRFERPTNAREVSQAAQEDAEAAAAAALERADNGIGQLEAQLRADSMPTPSTNPTERLLARQEITLLLDGTNNPMEAMSAFEQLTGSAEPAILGELVSEYGKQLMASRGLDDRQVDRVVDQLIEAVAAGRSKSTAARDAARALQRINALKAANASMRGGVDGTLKRVREKHRI